MDTEREEGREGMMEGDGGKVGGGIKGERSRGWREKRRLGDRKGWWEREMEDAATWRDKSHGLGPSITLQDQHHYSQKRRENSRQSTH